ncbi:hypothetical protein PRNP1_009748 [Phytophthora ramorum]
MAPLLEGKRAAAAATVTTLQMAAWVQVLAAETPLGSAEGEAKGDVGEEPEAEEIAGGDGDTAANDELVPAGLTDTQGDANPDALVLVGTASPPAKQHTSQATSKGEESTDSPVERDPIIDLGNATANTEEETLTTTLPTETTEPLATETPTEPLPKTIEPATIAEATTKPSLRTQDPAVNSNVVTNNTAETRAPGYLDQGTNPVVLIALGVICCIFLLLWGRKRRSSATSSSGTPGGTNSKRPNVQYTQVPDEQPFSHSQDDDDEYCDDYEEDTFANDRDNWDDWEGNSSQTQASQLNPFAAAPSAPRPTTPLQINSNSSPFKLTQPLPPPPQQQQQHRVQLQETAIAGKSDLLPSSVESNSSSDSFEVVAEEAHAPPASSRGAAADGEKESESVDDLFSQFGMVPTFKKSAVVPPPPAATSATPVSQSATATALSSPASLPTAAEASALFAAEMDDELTAVDAADEWGEDDEWVKGI